MPDENVKADESAEQHTDAQQDKKSVLKFTDADQAALRKSYEKKLSEAQTAHEAEIGEWKAKNSTLEKVVKDAVINVVTASMSPTERRLFEKLSIDEQLAEISNPDFMKDLKSKVKTPVTPNSDTADEKKPTKMIPFGR